MTIFVSTCYKSFPNQFNEDLHLFNIFLSLRIGLNLQPILLGNKFPKRVLKTKAVPYFFKLAFKDELFLKQTNFFKCFVCLLWVKYLFIFLKSLLTLVVVVNLHLYFVYCCKRISFYFCSYLSNNNIDDYNNICPFL